MPDRISLNLARIVHRVLVSPRGWGRKEICEDLEIADRTYRKYRGLLKELEPLIDPSGRWRIEEVREGEVRVLRLARGGTPPQTHPGFLGSVVGLWFGRRLMAFAGDSDLRAAAEAAWKDLTDSIKDKSFYLGHFLLNTDRMVHVIPDAPKDYSGREEEIRTLVHCLFFSRKVSFVYSSSTRGSRRHVVCPLTLVLWRSGLYLVGAYDDKAPKKYVFAVDRMADVCKGEGTFDYPVAEQYDPATLFEGSFGIWQEGSTGAPGKRALTPKRPVQLRFAANAWLHRYLRERTWHPSQRWEELEDGRLELTFEVSSLVEVWPWIRSFGDDVEVIRPRTREADGEAEPGSEVEAPA